LELAASALMFSRYRLFRALAGEALMVAAATTVLINGCFLPDALAAAPLYRSIPWLNLRKVAVSSLKMTATRSIFRTTTSNKNILQIFSTIG
jgi:hypothetical protein